MNPSNVLVMLHRETRRGGQTFTDEEEEEDTRAGQNEKMRFHQLQKADRDEDDDVLLSQQVAHTQRVLPGWIWSQSVGAAGHMVLPLRKPFGFTFNKT